MPVEAKSISLHDLSYAALDQLLTDDGVRAVHTRAIWQALHRKGVQDLAETSLNLSPPLQRWIAGLQGYSLDQLGIREDIKSTDGLTRKWLLSLEDGQTIETVRMAYKGRNTACLSSQVGCAMGCVFCATGQMGFIRHLRPGEIIAQALHVQRELKEAGSEAGLRNLVMMGMGEPLHNYDSVMAALETLTDPRGLNITPSRVSVSTVGVVPGILRMAKEQRPYSLAVSLHGSTNEERAELIPVSQRWPLSELIAACRQYGDETGKKIFFAWTLISESNDSPDHAQRLAALLEGIDAHVNLIPLNPTTGFEGKTSQDFTVNTFHKILRDAGIPTTIRQRRGIDVAAGCGQLKAPRLAKAP